MTLASASQFHVYLPCMGLVLVPSLASPTWMWSCVLTLPWPCLTSPEDSPPRARAPFVVKPPPELRLIWVFSSRLRCSFSCSLLPSLLSFFQHSHFKIGQLYILQGCELRLKPQLGTLFVVQLMAVWQMAVCPGLFAGGSSWFLHIYLTWHENPRAPLCHRSLIYQFCTFSRTNDYESKDILFMFKISSKIISIQYIWVLTRLSYCHQIIEIFLHFLFWFSFFNIIIICKFSLHHLSSL